MSKPSELAVYIHWPYCKSKCPYCDFYKELARGVNQDEVIAEYIAALHKYHELLPKRIVKSVFFGGGTPSLITPQNIERIINEIAALWPLSANAEITLEANPNTRSATLFTDFKKAGINRLSLGVQALNDADLRFLGRTHNLATARQCLAEIVEIFTNHSADLIYARPEQTLANWEKELAEITAYGLKHLSLYQLTIEENTVFARKNIQPLADEAALKMYDFTSDFLADRGYLQYEVSNFANPGYESTHNLTYWQGGDYIGIGKSAHGRYFSDDKFIAAVYPFVNEQLSAAERAEELILMGLRLVKGIDKHLFKQICGLDFYDCINRDKLSMLKELGLLTEDDTHLRATKAGFAVLNQIIAELCV